MKNKFLYCFFVLCLLIITSCNNITDNLTEFSANKDFTFSLGESSADIIVKTISKNKNINQDSELKVVCDLFGPNEESQTEVTTLENLKNLILKFENLPFGNGYYFIISVYCNDIILYKGTSAKFNLNKDEKDVKIKIALNKEIGNIKYVLNGGVFSAEQEKSKLTEYFVDTNYIIPEPSKSQFLFDGWYTNAEFTGNAVKELGKNNYLGNVTLYAKWREFDRLTEVTFHPVDDFIDFTDEVSLLNSENGVTIYYTTDCTEPTESSSKYSAPFALNVESDIKDNIVTIKAFATKTGMKSSNVAIRQYSIKRYSVNFDAAGGTCSSLAPITNLKKGDVVQIADFPVVTKDGFNFSGWNIGTGNETVKDSYTITGSDVMFTAQWTEKDRTPKVSITGEPLIDYGEEIILSCDTAPDAEIYYTIDGSVPDKSSSKYISGTTHITADKDFTLKAIAYKAGLKESYIAETSFTIKKYKVTFNNGNHGTAPGEITGLKKGDKLTAEQLKILPIDGYNFIQWETEQGFKFDTSSVIEKDVNLTAKWTAVTYTVVFDSNGGTGTKDSITATYDTDMPFGDNTFTRDGFEFVKWADSTGKTEYTSANNLCKKQDETITVYAQWNDIPPADITELKSETSNGKVILSWKNPTVADLDNVEITCKEDSSKNLTVKKDASKAIATAEYTGLPNDKIYTFTLKAVDGGGNKSTGVEKKAFASAGCQLTETVKNLPAGTDGSAGTSGTYVEFGDYPQSVKAADVLVSDNTVKVNGFDCHYGSDSCYYVKQNYISYDRDSNNNYICAEFNDGTTMIVGKEYYFKLEPLKWRVLDPDYLGNGGKLLLSEKAISSCAYFNYQPGVASTRRLDGKVLYNNNYEHSKVRAFLNGLSYLDKTNNISREFEGKGFINNAFTSTSINEVKEVIVDNSKASASSTIGDFACRNTNDKSFLLSYADSVNPKYNFNPNDGQTDRLKGRDSTEYARAMGAAFQKDAGFRTWWSLRTPNLGDWGHYRISWTYRTHPDAKILYDSYGVVPAIVVGGKYETPPSEVSNLKFEAGNNKVKLTWTEPEEADFAKVEVTCIETSQTKSANKGTAFIEFTGLTNGKKYNFTVKTVDKSNYKSTGSSVEVPLYLKTETPVTLKAGTAGTGGTDKTYVEFGDYPQTFVKNAPVGTDKVIIGGLDYYYGTDGNYYVQATASPDGDCSFDNKDKITQGEKYYFKVEPIKWRVLDSNYAVPSGTGKLLVAENALASCSFFSYVTAGSTRNIGSEATIYSNNYEHSKVRAFLTGVTYTEEGNNLSNEFEGKGFINQAFTNTAVNSICQIEVDNTIATTSAGTENYICKNTNDKVFLLSYKDITNTSYGFGPYGTNIAALRRASTDYSRAIGVLPTADNSTWWCTRSPNTGTKGDNTGCSIHRLSSVSQPKGDRGDTKYDNYGVVPAIVVKN